MKTVEKTEKSLHERPLPEGWRWARLGEVCSVPVSNRDPSRDPETPFCYIDISSIDTRTKQIVNARTLVGCEAPSRARQIVLAQDILVATTRPNLNAVAIVPLELDQAIASTGFCVLRCGPEICPEFVFQFVRLPSFVSTLTDLTKGSTYPAVTDAQVRDQKIPLPPFPEQRRIAAILREQMAAVEKARKAAQARLEAVKALPAAFLRQVFPQPGQPLPEGCRWARLGEVCEIVMGQSPVGASYNTDGVGEPLLNGPTEFGQVYPTAVQWTTSPTRFCYPGDILLCVRGATMGRKNRADQRYCIGRGLAAVRGRNACADNDFVWFALDLATGAILRAAAGSTFPNIPGDKLETIEIPVPPLSEQQRIAAILREQMAAVEKARKAAEEELETINNLPAAILRRAFNGEL